MFRINDQCPKKDKLYCCYIAAMLLFKAQYIIFLIEKGEHKKVKQYYNYSLLIGRYIRCNYYTIIKQTM